MVAGSAGVVGRPTRDFRYMSKWIVTDPCWRTCAGKSPEETARIVPGLANTGASAGGAESIQFVARSGRPQASAAAARPGRTATAAAQRIKRASGFLTETYV